MLLHKVDAEDSGYFYASFSGNRFEGLAADDEEVGFASVLADFVRHLAERRHGGMTVQALRRQEITGRFEALHALGACIADAVLLRAGVEEEQVAVPVDVDRDKDQVEGVEAFADVTFHSSSVFGFAAQIKCTLAN